MTHLTSISALCVIGFFLLIEPSCCASRETQLPPNFCNHQGHQLSLPKLPRRLKMTEEVAAAAKGHATEDIKPHESYKGDNSAYPVHREHETRREHGAKEGADSSPLFTMDYSPVRRRRPIHNRSLPVGP